MKSHHWSKANAAAIGIVLVSIVAAVLLLYISRYLLCAALLGIVLANAIHRTSVFLHPKIKFPAFWISLLQMIFLAGAIGGIIYLGYDTATEQFDKIAESFTQTYENVKAELEQTKWGSSLVGDEQNKGAIRNATGWLANQAYFMLGSLGPIAIFLVIVVYGALDPRPYRRGVLWLLPDDWQTRVIELFDTLSDALLWWLAGRIVSMLIVGVMTWLGLWIMGIPGPIALGLIAGLFSFVPNLGPVLSVVPALLVAFAVGPLQPVYVLALYIGIQALESNLITPMIQRQVVTTPPALLIVFQFAMGLVAGVWGMIVATPLLVVMMVLIQQIYIRDTLKRDGPLVTEK